MEPTAVRDELAWIRSLMAESQSFLHGTWQHQFLWGLLAAIGLAGTWFAVEAEAFGRIYWAWSVVLILGWTASLTLASRSGAAASVRSVASRAFGGIWLSLGITLSILGVVTLTTGAISPRLLPGLIAIVLGAGYNATGFLAGLRWLQGVGIAWWAGGVALLLWASPDALLALAGMSVVLEMGPALVLRDLEKNQPGTP